MNKVPPKPARASYVSKASAPKAKILYCEDDSSVLSAQARAFEKAGYAVERVEGRKAAEQALHAGSYDVVVLGHTLTKDDRHHLPYMAKKGSRDTRVLVLHASGKHPAVDWALDSREGDEAVLTALASLAEYRLAIAG
ncbi:MAG TPA: hypothetical protein VN577_06255 [Terriglobales bacterium]|nr:hypothetical protein [Terriglobales bacterium]